MAKKAVEGIQDLIDRTGGPKVKATVTVDQIYAQNQHETLYFRHPRGGMAKYLETPLFAEHPKWIEEFANRVLRSSSAAREWGGVGRKLVKAVTKTAPVEFGDLRRSGALEVREGASVVVNEPAPQKRLSEAERDAKDYMRHAGQGYRE